MKNNSDDNNKLLKNIDDVSKIINVKKHVLRHWENRLQEIGSNILILRKGRDGKRRYYRNSDIQTLKKIKYLLYNKKYTLKGVALKLNSKLENNHLSEISHNLKKLSSNIRDLLNIKK